MTKQIGQCAHHLIEAQSKLTPDALALRMGTVEVSYRDLNDRANRIARRLQQSGIRPEVLVGIYLADPLQALPALLGVLKSGGAFVPMDPAFPAERLEYMIRDARMPVVLTTAAERARLPEDLGSAVWIDPDGVDVHSQSAEEVTSAVKPDSASCVIYTSGSTGKPKGVIRTHRGIVSRLSWIPFDRADVFCHNMSLTTGFSQERVLLPWMRGLPVVVTEGNGFQNMAAFLESLDSGGVTEVTLVPGTIRELLRTCSVSKRRPLTLRRVAVGGAALPADVARDWIELLPEIKVATRYGSTESGTIVAGTVSSADVTDRLPAGAPVARSRVYICGPELDLLPSGEAGEIYAAAHSLARGYLNRPDLTAAAFLPNPFSGVSGDRMYRLGDLGRFRPDGKLEILGRADRQVKVRGFRVELDEVQSALESRDGIVEAVVTAIHNQDDAQLIAHIVAAPGHSLRIAELRRSLSASLPEYMIPARFVFLDRLPRGLNGKVDVSALPPPRGERPDIGVEYAPPRDAAEEVVASLWEEMLELDVVGTGDNFFMLGGDSLLAVKTLTEISETFGIELSPEIMLDHPTIERLLGAVFAGSEGTSRRRQINTLLEQLSAGRAEPAVATTAS